MNDKEKKRPFGVPIERGSLFDLGEDERLPELDEKGLQRARERDDSIVGAIVAKGKRQEWADFRRKNTVSTILETREILAVTKAADASVAQTGIPLGQPGNELDEQAFQKCLKQEAVELSENRRLMRTRLKLDYGFAPPYEPILPEISDEAYIKAVKAKARFEG